MIWVNFNKGASFSPNLSLCGTGFEEHNRCRVIWDACPDHHRFLIKKWKREEDANLCLRHNLCLFYSITQALFMFTPSHLAISQINDISNLKAWNILEQSMERSSHTFTSLGWVPNGEKKRFGACFGGGTKEFRLVWSRQFLVVSWLSISHSLS